MISRGLSKEKDCRSTGRTVTLGQSGSRERGAKPLHLVKTSAQGDAPVWIYWALFTVCMSTLFVCEVKQG